MPGVDAQPGGPGSRGRAASGNFLAEIPGQGRSSTREGASRENEQRVEIAAKLSLFLSADTGRLDREQSPNEAAFEGNTEGWEIQLGNVSKYAERVTA